MISNPAIPLMEENYRYKKSRLVISYKILFSILMTLRMKVLDSIENGNDLVN